MKKYMSMDCESDGLWGDIISIGFVVFDEEGNVLERWNRYNKNAKITDGWVKKNVLPTIGEENEGLESLDKLLDEFTGKWYEWKEDVTVLWHMGHIVESHLFKTLKDTGWIGEWDAPYCPIEVATLLQSVGEQGDSVDKYMRDRGREVVGVHNALCDAETIKEVFLDILKTRKEDTKCLKNFSKRINFTF